MPENQTAWTTSHSIRRIAHLVADPPSRPADWIPIAPAYTARLSSTNCIRSTALAVGQNNARIGTSDTILFVMRAIAEQL